MSAANAIDAIVAGVLALHVLGWLMSWAYDKGVKHTEERWSEAVEKAKR